MVTVLLSVLIIVAFGSVCGLVFGYIVYRSHKQVIQQFKNTSNNIENHFNIVSNNIDEDIKRFNKQMSDSLKRGRAGI